MGTYGRAIVVAKLKRRCEVPNLIARVLKVWRKPGRAERVIANVVAALITTRATVLAPGDI